jgi:hypothetical protein
MAVLTCKYWTKLESLAGDKHSSLRCRSISDKEKVMTLTPDVNVLKLLFFLILEGQNKPVFVDGNS